MDIKQSSVMAQPEGDVFTLAEAAAYLKVRVSTMRAWIYQRRIAFSKPGGRLIRIRRVDLEKMLAARTVPATWVRGGKRS